MSTPAAVETTISTSCLHRARQGDSLAWEQIWKTYSNRVYRQILRCDLPPATAEELTVDVFDKVWRNLHQFSRQQNSESLGAWINCITANSVRDYFRSLQRIPTPAGSCAGNHIVHVESSAKAPTPGRLALWRAMGIVENETSERHWECFRMARFAGLPHAEIGQRLGLTSTNVSTIANRIYDSIRREAEHQRRLIDREQPTAPQI